MRELDCSLLRSLPKMFSELLTNPRSELFVVDPPRLPRLGTRIPTSPLEFLVDGREEIEVSFRERSVW